VLTKKSLAALICFETADDAAIKALNSPHRKIPHTGLDWMDTKKYEQEQQEKWENSTTSQNKHKHQNDDQTWAGRH
jgi:hypothetical protein